MMIPNLTFTLSEISSAVAATQALSRLDSMIESNGSGQFRFDTVAVSMATDGVFKYGDVQRWNSPANQIDVTITKVS
jgi:hypothetical protein